MGRITVDVTARVDFVEVQRVLNRAQIQAVFDGIAQITAASHPQAVASGLAPKVARKKPAPARRRKA